MICKESVDRRLKRPDWRWSCEVKEIGCKQNCKRHKIDWWGCAQQRKWRLNCNENWMQHEHQFVPVQRDAKQKESGYKQNWQRREHKLLMQRDCEENRKGHEQWSWRIYKDRLQLQRD